MATEQTISISGDPPSTVVSGVTVPYANTSDLEIYIGKGLVEKVVLDNAGAGYDTVSNAALEFSGGGGSSAALTVDVSSGQVSLDNAGVPDPKGSGYTSSPIVGFGNLTGGTGASATAEIYAKKTPVTHYTLSGTSGNTTITFEAGLLADGDKVLIKRATGVSTAANTFVAGSAITAKALNKSFDHIRYKVEELPNVTSTAVTNGVKDDIEVSGSNWTIVNDAVTSAKIADDAIDSEHYKAGSIDLEHMSANSIDSDQYVDGSIDLAHMSANSVDSDQYVDGSIDLVHMSANSVDSDQYVDGSIDNVHIADNQIEEPKLKISNSPTDGHFLQYKDSSDKLTWAEPAALRSGEIIETFMLPCNGSQITVGSGTYTTQNVTTVQQLTSTFSDITGSSIAYRPPVGTQLVIYKFCFHSSMDADTTPVFHAKLLLDGAEVTRARYTHQTQKDGRNTIEWPFQIGGSADADTGKVASDPGWDTTTSLKTIKIQAKEYHSDNEAELHNTYQWDGSESAQLVLPTISITAIN